ncbi:hypothetical protein JCM5296_003496 [Sporobolomyces johnsonii]
MAPLLQFKAGRSFRQGDSNQVVSQPDRGLVYLQEEDGLLHFYYKDLSSQAVVEDLIIFPGDASLKVADKQHRVHVLKFNSSSARHFFWHQDPGLSEDEFEQRGRRVNELIGGEQDEQGMDVEAPAPAPAAPVPAASSSTLETPAPTSRTTPAAAPQAPKKPAGSDAQLAQLENILATFRAAGGMSMGGGGASSSNVGGAPDFALPDVLPPSVASTLIASLPPSTLAHLSSFLPTHPSLPSSTPASQRASLSRALSSPEFRRALGSLDRALRTGATGPLVQSLGLRERAAQGTREFLEEVQRVADEDKDKGKEELEGGDGEERSSMETD